MEQDQLDGVLPCANASGSDEGSLLIMCILVEQIKSKKEADAQVEEVCCLRSRRREKRKRRAKGGVVFWHHLSKTRYPEYGKSLLTQIYLLSMHLSLFP